MKDSLPKDVPEVALNVDAHLACARGLRASVVRKAGRSKRWEDVATGLEDLLEAVLLAASIEAYESGVFVNKEGVGGKLYWTSLCPNVLNSLVLAVKFDNSE